MAISIQDWLKGDRDYEAGLHILEASGASKFLIDLLSSGPDHYNTPKLLAEIEKLAAASQVDAIVQGTSSQIDAMADVSDLAWQLESMEDALSDLASQVDAIGAAKTEPATETYVPDHNLEKKMRYDAQIRQLWKEICYLHAQMDLLPEGERLYAVAQELMIKNMRRADLWDHLHYFNANGVWFDDPENQPKPENPEQQIKNLMANRSKAQAKLKKPLPAAKRQFYLDKIASLTAQIDKLKGQRNG